MTSSLELLELSTEDYEILDSIDGEPNSAVKTGFDSSEGATELRIYRITGPKTFTIVVPAGEHQNAEPWKFEGHPSDDEILQEYLEAMQGDEE